MKPFSAWLAMSHNKRPMKYADGEDRGSYSYRYEAFSNKKIANAQSPHAPQRVLVIADTEENRRKLGIE